MKFSKFTWVLIILSLIMIVVQAVYYYDGGCTRVGCMGPWQIYILWSPFSEIILLTLIYPFLASIFVGLAFSLKLEEDKNSKKKKVAIDKSVLIKASCISFLLFSTILALYFSRMVY